MDALTNAYQLTINVASATEERLVLTCLRAHQGRLPITLALTTHGAAEPATLTGYVTSVSVAPDGAVTVTFRPA